jgi:ATP-dependent exoDNAse (exonuclease V) alpha subunit
VIEKNEYDPNSQQVRLIVGCPVVAIRNKRSLKIVNSAVFTVKKLDPLTLKDNLTKDEIEIDIDTFKEYFYIGYCTTTHKAQGETFSKPYTIWEFNRMSDEMKYTSISRASSKDLINVVRNDTREVKIEQDTDFDKIKERLKRAERMKDPIYKKRYEAMIKLNRILKGECSEEYCLKNTLKTRLELLQNLGLPNKRINISIVKSVL